MTNARRPYPSDLSDAEWVLLKSLLRRHEKRGRSPKWPVRLIADSVFYLLRSGCAWRMLPREFPPWPTVYYRFRKWHRDGTLARAHDLLRGEVRAREGGRQRWYRASSHLHYTRKFLGSLTVARCNGLATDPRNRCV